MPDSQGGSIDSADRQAPGAVVAPVQPLRRPDIEGDVAYAAGRRQDLTFAQGALPNQPTPNMLPYMGNIVYSPLGSRRSLAPYAVGGIGALTMFNQPAVANLGVTSNQTYFAGDIGAGARWFVTDHWGLPGS